MNWIVSTILTVKSSVKLEIRFIPQVVWWNISLISLRGFNETVCTKQRQDNASSVSPYFSVFKVSCLYHPAGGNNEWRTVLPPSNISYNLLRKTRRLSSTTLWCWINIPRNQRASVWHYTTQKPVVTIYTIYFNI